MIKGQKTKNMFLQYETNLKAFRESIIKVGLPEKTGSVQHENADGLTVAQIGAVHEYGVPEQGIWKRSFIREPIINNQKKINKFIKMKFSQVGDNSMSAKTALSQIGIMASDISKASFRKNDWKPLSPQTIKRKNNKSNPLIDTGQLRGSITYTVERA